MAYDYDTDALGQLVGRMRALPADRRLEALKRAVIEHGGRWDLPSEKPGVYNPVLVSAQVFGVCAFAESIDELHINWLRAAENALAWEDREDADRQMPAVRESREECA